MGMLQQRYSHGKRNGKWNDKKKGEHETLVTASTQLFFFLFFLTTNILMACKMVHISYLLLE